MCRRRGGCSSRSVSGTVPNTVRLLQGDASDGIGDLVGTGNVSRFPIGGWRVQWMDGPSRDWISSVACAVYTAPVAFISKERFDEESDWCVVLFSGGGCGVG